MATNLPNRIIEDSAAATKLFFDSYGQQPLEFNAVDVDTTMSFFEKRGFAHDASIVVATALLKQAKIDGIPISVILDSLTGFNGIQLSTLVGEVLNNNRVPTSTLGFRTEKVVTNQTKNISA